MITRCAEAQWRGLTAEERARAVALGHTRIFDHESYYATLWWTETYNAAGELINNSQLMSIKALHTALIDPPPGKEVAPEDLI